MHRKLLFVLFIIWLLPFVFTSFFNQPAIDDYWNANAINAYGKLGAVQHFYHTVSGRYFSLFIMSVCNTLPKDEVWIFKVWPIITIALLYVSFYFLYSSFFTNLQFKSDASVFSFLFVVCHIAAMRSLFEGLYWMSSTVCYQLAICLFAISIGAIVRDAKKSNSTMKSIAIASSLLLPGTVEMVISLYFFALVLLLYFAYKLQHAKSTIVVCLAVTIALAFIVLLSKGSSARIENNSSTYQPSVGAALWYCARSIAYYTAIYIINPLFISAFLIAGLFSHLKNKTPFVLSLVDCIVVFCYFILSCLAVYLPLHLFEAPIPFPRVTTLFFLVFFCTCLFIVLSNSAAIFRLVDKITVLKSRNDIKAVLLIVFFLSAFTNRNFVVICKDLFNGTSMKYNIESYQRYNAIESCKRDTCFVLPHQYWPYFAQSSKDEISDPNHFQHMNIYFKKTILFR